MITGSLLLTTLIILLGAVGTYLLLPHQRGQNKPRTVYAAGAVLTSLGVLGFLSLLVPPSSSAPDGFFYVTSFFFYLFSFSTLGAAVMTVTSRNPIYSALWFAAVILSTSGLFLLAGAQFLAAGTIIVYAGAIIVTFLFVIMLAQMEGKAVYDRSARTPGRAVLTCFLLLWSLVYCLGSLAVRPEGLDPNVVTIEQKLTRGREIASEYRLHDKNPTKIVLDRALRPTSSIYTDANLEKPDVAGLGEALYADHLVTVELAGSLLFVALIAAVAITNPKRPVRPGDASLAKIDG